MLDMVLLAYVDYIETGKKNNKTRAKPFAIATFE